MSRSFPVVFASLLFLPSIPTFGAVAKPVAATVGSTLKTGSGQIRQLAFDGDPATYFESDAAPTTGDRFALSFDTPVAVKRMSVATGRPDGTDALDSGTLEASADGKTFEDLATFAKGAASVELGGRLIQAIRLKPGASLPRRLVIREFTIESDPPVATFAFPIEFTVDTDDAPEMKDWAERAARECERWYPQINEALKSPGYKPPRRIAMTLSSRYNGVAEAGGGRIRGSVKWFKAHPDDLGAMIHETCHIVQNYHNANNPGWLVEGVADHVRFFVYEPGKIGPINPARARYNASYRTTAAFLAYVSETYDKDLVLKLNALMRAGTYQESIFKDLTGKPVRELDDEWRATLHR